MNNRPFYDRGGGRRQRSNVLIVGEPQAYPEKHQGRLKLGPFGAMA
jgi:hypothetical protein